MKIVVLIALFIVGALLFNKSQIRSWFVGAGKPNVPHWKIYATLSFIVWVLFAVLVYVL